MSFRKLTLRRSGGVKKLSTGKGIKAKTKRMTNMSRVNVNKKVRKT